MSKFEGYCSPQANPIFERFKFHSVTQKEGQSFDIFLTELRKAVKTTGYKDQDDMIRDRIVMGIMDKSTQERLLRESQLTLTKAIELCRATEVSKSQSQVLQHEVHVNTLKSRNKTNSSSAGSSRFESTSSDCLMCKFCGYKHGKGANCPAFGKTCAKCQGRNHFAKV